MDVLDREDQRPVAGRRPDQRRDDGAAAEIAGAVVQRVVDGALVGRQGPVEQGGEVDPMLRAERAGGRLLGAVAPTAVLIAAMWVAQFVLIFLGRVIIPGVGLIPRRLDGLDGVLFSPVLHAGWAHLIGNTTALLVLGPLAALVSRRPVALLVCAWLGSGLLTWVIGTPGVHIGASGIVYALIAFLIVYGIAVRRIGAVVVSVLVALTHLGSSLIGLLPAPGISWTGHLAGAVVGVLLGLWWGRADRQVPNRR